jgi:hypothetical protein
MPTVTSWGLAGQLGPLDQKNNGGDTAPAHEDMPSTHAHRALQDVNFALPRFVRRDHAVTTTCELRCLGLQGRHGREDTRSPDAFYGTNNNRQMLQTSH